MNNNVIEEQKLMLFFLEEAHNRGRYFPFSLQKQKQKSTNQIHALQAWADTAAMALPGDFTSLYG